MAYVILVNDDNSLYGSKKERIMQRSKCVDVLKFVVNPIYKDIDMTDASVMLEYILPVSREYKTEYLVLSDEKYNDCFLQYNLPFDSNLTKESGAIELQLTFVRADLDSKGNPVQMVRKTSTTTIDIIPISAWSDLIPDEALSALDQRIMMQDAQIKTLNDLINAFDGSSFDGNVTMVDNLVYNKAEETLQLSSNGVGVGSKVSIRDMIDDGVPVVDLGSDDDDNSNDDNLNGEPDNCSCDDVVEF